jgi:hypothetical protein
MPERDKVSNFGNFQIEFEPVLGKDSRHVFFCPEVMAWLKKNKILEWSLYRIQSLAEI